MRALFLFMQFQRQPIWIKEKCHLLLGVAVQSNRFASYPHLFQFCYSGFHIIHPERQMPQSAGFRSIHALRWVRLCEDLQLNRISTLTNTQIQFPVIPFFTEVFSYNRKSQLVHIEVFRFLII